jgi:hypothetical protein
MFGQYAPGQGYFGAAELTLEEEGPPSVVPPTGIPVTSVIATPAEVTSVIL